MKEMRKKLGDYITQRREKNTSDDLPICGVCREGLIPPKQQDADISLYNVFYKNDFIFNPARMELNSITLNTQHDKAICSSLYEIFYINDTSILLPEFLFVQLKTDNFIRFCEFQGQGSVREYCRFANISEYPVIVPDIKEQQKIVDTYNAITNRIQIKQKINENLEKTAQCLFEECKKNSTKSEQLSNFITIKHGYAFDGDYFSLEDNNKVLLTPGNFKLNGGFQEEKCKFYTGDIPQSFILKGNDLIVTMTDLSKDADTLGYSALIPVESNRVYLHNQRIGLVQFKNDILSKDYIYWFMRSFDYHKKVVGSSSGTTVHHTSPDRICEIEIPISQNQNEMVQELSSINKEIEINNRELLLLKKLEKSIVSQISKR